MPTYAFTLPFGIDSQSAYVVLGKRQLIQKRSGGRTIKGQIPEWAGQWGLIGGAQRSGETPEDTAIRTFREQTAIDLTDLDVQSNFLLQNRALGTLETPDYTAFGVLCIFTTRAALDLLQTVITDVIGTAQASEDLLAQAAVFAVGAARQKPGPTPPPPQGWKSYLVANYYGGTAPGQLNTEINVLTKQLTASAAQDNAFAVTALSDQTPS